MTTAMPRLDRRDSVLGRLDQLRAERLELLAELTAPSSGDDADRATNVDGHVRVAMLDRRIVTLEEELSAIETGDDSTSSGIRPGDVITLDFGDGPETYLFGSVEQALDGTDVITPGSPLGTALAGAEPGRTISYTAKPGRTLQVTVAAVS